MVEVAFPLDANIQVMGELVDRLGMPTKKVITDLYNFGNPSVEVFRWLWMMRIV